MKDVHSISYYDLIIVYNTRAICTRHLKISIVCITIAVGASPLQSVLQHWSLEEQIEYSHLRALLTSLGAKLEKDDKDDKECKIEESVAREIIERIRAK